ncbi:MAG: 4Fe-4S binding protein [Bacteroidota bacterium]
MFSAHSGYWEGLWSACRNLAKGMKLTGRRLSRAVRGNNKEIGLDIRHPDYFRHQEGITTLSYPHEKMPVPENGRYKLHNEIDDCIVCDKCVKVCPVNCITIEPIRSPEEFGKTSDGTSKRIHAATFDIDMSKCCFCGLCTTVCPTECLTMTPEYDYSTFDLRDHNFAFATMTEAEILQRKAEWEQHLAAKAAAAANAASSTPATGAAPKPVFRPAKPKL